MAYSSAPVFSNRKTRKNIARAIVEATTHYEDYDLIAEVSKELGSAMTGIEISKLSAEERMQERGW